MNISKFLKRKTTSCYASVSSKSTEKVSWDKDEENINVITNCNNKGVEEDGSGNLILNLLDKTPSDNDDNASLIVFQTIFLNISKTI